jgi:hypothetical protein
MLQGICHKVVMQGPANLVYEKMYRDFMDT